MGKASEAILSLSIGIAVARYLGPAPLGGLTVALLIMGIFQRLTIGGIILSSSKAIASSENQEERLSWESAARRIVRQRSLIWTAGAIATGLFLPKEIGWALILAATAIPLNAGECRAWALHTNLESKHTILASRLAQLNQAAAKALLILIGAPAWSFAISAPISEWTKTLWLTWRVKYPPPKPQEIEILKKGASGLRLSVLTKYIMGTLPTLTLGSLSTAAAGLYTCALKINTTALLPIQLVSQSVNPSVMRSGDWKKPWSQMTICGALLAIPLFLGADWIVPTLFGPAFSGAASASKWLAVAIIPAAGNPTLEAALMARNLPQPIRAATLASVISGVAAATLAWGLDTNLYEIAAIFTTTVGISTSLGMLLALQKR